LTRLTGRSSPPSAGRGAAADGEEDRLAWFREHAEHDPAVTARKVRVPALVLTGDRDALVLPYHALALAQALTEAGNRRVTLRILPGLTHLFTPAEAKQGAAAGQVSAEFLQTLRDWMTTALPAK
jgi:fermentation-respiration switch protein FrsA (DUF1100 family)